MFIDYINSYREDLINLGIEAICRAMHLELKKIYETQHFIAYDNKRFFHLLIAYQALNPDKNEYIISLIKKIRSTSTAYLSDEDKNNLIDITKFLYEYSQNHSFHREQLALLQMEELLWQLQQ